MRARTGALAFAIAFLVLVIARGASAAPMNVTMTPTSGPSGTTVTASSNDTCPPVPESNDSNIRHEGPIIVQQVKPASAEPPGNDEGWDMIEESDGTPEEGDAPWSGTFQVGAASGEGALAPGAYTVYFACAYHEEVIDTGGAPRTDGPPTAYGDKTLKAFQVCQTGTQTCASSTSSSTSSTSTSTSIAASTSTTNTTAAPATTSTTAAAASTPSARPGATVDVTAIGFRPNSTGTVDFESTPVRVGTFTANAQGNVAVAVRIPANATRGQHHIVLTGVDPNGAPRTLRVAINVSGGTIARAGSPTTLLLVFAGGIVCVGAVLRLRAGDLRRSRGAHHITG